MAMNKSFSGRAAAVLTTGEVAGATFDVDKAARAEHVLDFSFTLGSLTNVILRFFGSVDGVTWDPIQDTSGNVSYTLTASTERMFVFNQPGVKNFRASVQGTGTVTSSSCAFTHRYRALGSW